MTLFKILEAFACLEHTNASSILKRVVYILYIILDLVQVYNDLTYIES